MFVKFFIYILGLISLGIPQYSYSLELQNLMGIEVETSAIKVRSPASDKLGFGFTRIRDEQLIFSLEEDTLDATFGAIPLFEDFDRNLEIKTHGGLNQAEINQITPPIEAILNTLYDRALPAPLKIEEGLLEAIVGGEYRASPRTPTQPEFLIKSKEASADKRILKPQITYQLPLRLLSRIFERLSTLQHQGISYFVNDLNPSVPLSTVSASRLAEKMGDSPAAMLFSKLLRNKEKGDPVRRYFKEHIAPAFASLPEGPAKGLIHLFLYYWYELFNNKDPVGPEPGLKQYLGIMSRVPLSQLYDGLEETEKTTFRDFLIPHLEFGMACILRPYFDYDEAKISPAMTLPQWFESIVVEERRQTIKKRQVDLLSPPPRLPNDYSMGLLNIKADAPNLALVEARGYSTIRYGEGFLTINNLSDFVRRESTWFFEE